MEFFNCGINPRAEKYLERLMNGIFLYEESVTRTFSDDNKLVIEPRKIYQSCYQVNTYSYKRFDLLPSSSIYQFTRDDDLFMHYGELDEFSVNNGPDVRVLVQSVFTRTKRWRWPLNFLSSKTHIFFLALAEGGDKRKWIADSLWNETEIRNRLASIPIN